MDLSTSDQSHPGGRRPIAALSSAEKNTQLEENYRTRTGKLFREQRSASRAMHPACPGTRNIMPSSGHHTRWRVRPTPECTATGSQDDRPRAHAAVPTTFLVWAMCFFIQSNSRNL